MLHARVDRAFEVELRHWHELGRRPLTRGARGQEWGGRGGEGGEGVSDGLQREREVWVQEGEEEVRWEARSVERTSTRRAEAGSTAQWSQMLTSSTFGIEDLSPRTKDGLGQAVEERAMAGG